MRGEERRGDARGGDASLLVLFIRKNNQALK
jgi:hypothetical protein